MHTAEEVRTKTNHLRGLFGQHELREMLLAYADLLEKCEVEQRELSFAQEQIKELLQVLADEGRNIPHRYVEVDGICHRLLGTSSISAFERLERRKDTQIAALQAENAELSINPDIAEYAKLREQLAALREALKQAHDAMEAFTDPEGNMPERTGEFRDLKAAMLSIRSLLGVPK